MILMSTNLLAGEIKSIEKFDLNLYRGKVVYLDFWASWCKPCQKSFPWMNQLKARYPSDKFEVVTINVDARAEDMQNFLRQVPADFTIYHDPRGTLAGKFALPGMPTSFLIDKSGRAVNKHIGFYKKNLPAIESEIESLL